MLILAKETDLEIGALCDNIASELNEEERLSLLLFSEEKEVDRFKGLEGEEGWKI